MAVIIYSENINDLRQVRNTPLRLQSDPPPYRWNQTRARSSSRDVQLINWEDNELYTSSVGCSEVTVLVFETRRCWLRMI